MESPIISPEMSVDIQDRIDAYSALLAGNRHQIIDTLLPHWFSVEAMVNTLQELLGASLSSSDSQKKFLYLVVADSVINYRGNNEEWAVIWKQVASDISIPMAFSLQQFISKCVAEGFRLRALISIASLQMDREEVTSEELISIAQNSTQHPDGATRALRVLSTNLNKVKNLALTHNLPVNNPVVLLSLSEIISGWNLPPQQASKIWFSLANSYGVTENASTAIPLMPAVSGVGITSALAFDTSANSLNSTPFFVEDFLKKLTEAATTMWAERAIEIVIDALDQNQESTSEVIIHNIKYGTPKYGNNRLPGGLREIIEALVQNLEFCDQLAYAASRMIPLAQRPVRARACFLLGASELVVNNGYVLPKTDDDSVAKKWQKYYGKTDKGFSTVYDALERSRRVISLYRAMQEVYTHEQILRSNLRAELPDLSRPRITSQILHDVKTFRTQAVDILQVLVINRDSNRVDMIDQAIIVAAISNFYGYRDRGESLPKDAVDQWVTLSALASSGHTVSFLNGVLDNARLQIFGQSHTN